mmetsp:Transcript_47944/g.48820  ORF Transcript_47944/g.48820 Transcript_47944/m.48820 type:complete len:89 (-) Transcript_47944:301-567(-)
MDGIVRSHDGIKNILKKVHPFIAASLEVWLEMEKSGCRLSESGGGMPMPGLWNIYENLPIILLGTKTKHASTYVPRGYTDGNNTLLGS